MKPKHLLLVGCGDIGSRVGRALVAAGGRVTAVRRRTELLPDTFSAIAGDFTKPEVAVRLAECEPDGVLFTPSPTRRDEAGYREGFHDAVATMVSSGLLAGTSAAVMVSSTRVYAESSGGWVDEDAALTSSDSAGKWIAAAETLFLGAAAPGTVVRASGLYGELPGMLLSRVASGQASADGERYSNRIHRQDLARALLHTLNEQFDGREPPGIVNATDSAPAPIGEVEAWLARRLGVELSAQQDAAPPKRANRRCANQRLLALGFEFLYPSYREGYEEMLSRDTP